MRTRPSPSRIDFEISLSEKLAHIKQELREEYQSDHEFPWIIGFSGGKDSTLLLFLVFEMLMDLAPGDRKRDVHIVANDTLVESPVLAKYLNKTLTKLQTVIPTLRVPVTVKKTVPKLDQTFWVNLIGRGYPSPSRSFRWCTDRMKIQPTSEYIHEFVDRAGQVILLLGVRYDESASRAASIRRYSNGKRLNAHNTLKGCMVYRPIVDLATKEVWTTLLQSRLPWGGNVKELANIYRNALGGDCPVVTDVSDAPSCGTSSSRLGCWTCTVVVKDRSMEAFIDAGVENLEPLLDFRDWLAEIREVEKYPEMRMALRRGGFTTYLSNGKLVPGPFTLAARREILSRLLLTQEIVREVLISQAEIDLIHDIWSQDASRELILE